MFVFELVFFVFVHNAFRFLAIHFAFRGAALAVAAAVCKTSYNTYVNEPEKEAVPSNARYEDSLPHMEFVGSFSFLLFSISPVLEEKK